MVKFIVMYRHITLLFKIPMNKTVLFLLKSTCLTNQKEQVNSSKHMTQEVVTDSSPSDVRYSS